MIIYTNKKTHCDIKNNTYLFVVVALTRTKSYKMKGAKCDMKHRTSYKYILMQQKFFALMKCETPAALQCFINFFYIKKKYIYRKKTFIHLDRHTHSI